MKRIALALALIGALCNSAYSADDAAKQQVVLLKFDDVIAGKPTVGPVSARWRKLLDYLVTNKIRAGFGIITESLEADNPAYFQWLKDVQQAGQIEFWMHGYHMKKAVEQGEFEHGTFEEQKAVLEKAEKLAKEKLGFALPAFGPHWSGTTDETDQALEAVPDVTIWLYGPKKPKFFTRLSIERIMALENPTFVPDSAKFKATYEKSATTAPVLALQGHPDQWDDKRWAGFLEIIEFLKSKNVVFMTPSEYLKTVVKPK